MKKITILLLSLFTALSLTVPAAAENSFYGGVGAGVIQLDDYCKDANILYYVDSCDDSALAARVHMGWKPVDVLAAEVGYTHTGEMSLGLNNANGSFIGEATFNYTAFDFSATASYPLTERAEGFVRLGIAFWETKVDGPAGVVSADETDFLYGLGAAYTFDKSIVGKENALTADWTHVSGDADANLFLLNARVAF